MKIIVTWRVSVARSVGTSTLDPSATRGEKKICIKNNDHNFLFVCLFIFCITFKCLFLKLWEAYLVSNISLMKYKFIVNVKKY